MEDINKKYSEQVKNILERWPEIEGVYQTSDGRFFIRLYEEAFMHSNGLLDDGTEPLVDKTIKYWFEEYSGKDMIPNIRFIEVGTEHLKIV
jgi:hypothetical protein